MASASREDEPERRDDEEGREAGESGQGGQGDPWDDVVLDESFVREAQVEEPAARTRMLRERWRREAPTPQPWRSDIPPAGGLGEPGPARRPRRRRRWFRRKGQDGSGE